MFCYRDMTFCEQKDCGDWDICPKALTAEVIEKAEKWMKDAPIAVYMDRPDCFKEKGK